MKYKNIKKQKAKDKVINQTAPKQNKLFLWQTKILPILFFIIIFLFLSINLIYSQKINPLYLRLIDNDKKAVVEFLQKTKTLPLFSQELEKYKNIYGKTFEEEVFAKENERKQMIKNLEQILEKNPNARDVLYGLYWLYHEDGDKIRAQEYLRQAKEVDPSIK